MSAPRASSIHVGSWALPRTGSAPAALSEAADESDRARARTRTPRSTASFTTALPMKPVPPTRKIVVNGTACQRLMML